MIWRYILAKQGETKFKERVLKDLKKLERIWYKKLQERSRRGILDILICLKGRFIVIELKIDGEVPTPLQKNTAKEISHAGGITFAATPSSWEQDYEILKTL